MPPSEEDEGTRDPQEAPEPGKLQPTASEAAPDSEAGEADAGDETNRLLEPYVRTATRIARAVRALLAAHVIVVRNEAEREIFRYLTGMGLAAGAMMFLFSSAILASVTLVVGIQRVTGLPLLESLLICLGTTVTFASFLGLLAYLRLRRAPMPDSRELIRKTLDGITPPR